MTELETPAIPGLIHGLRTWTLDVNTDPPQLAAIAQRQFWPLREPLRAHCSQGHDHVAPDPECGCGIYALHPAPASAEYIFSELLTNVNLGLFEEGRVLVFGLVEAWGELEVHRAGFRTSTARTRTLFVPDADLYAPEANFMFIARRYGELVAAYAEASAVNVLSIGSPRDILGYCERACQGLPKRWVDELVDSVSEVELTPELYAFSGDEGQPIAGSGFRAEVDEDVMYGVPENADTGAEVIFKVAGAGFRPDALQAAWFDPGEELRLIPEPENKHGPNAIGVWDRDGTEQIGYVPADLTDVIGERIARGRAERVISLFQWRELTNGDRLGLQVLVAPDVEIRFLDPDEAEDEDLYL